MTILPAKYCPDCGRKLTTRPHEDTRQPYCVACERMFWQQPIPSVDIAVVEQSSTANRVLENAMRFRARGNLRFPQPSLGDVIDGSQVLLIKRDNPPNVGTWALPGGFIDVGETPEQAAVRELNEETGLDASTSDLHLFDTYTVAVEEKGWHNIGLNFAVSRERTTGMPVAGTDAQDARFWSLEGVLATEVGLRPEPDDEAQIRKAIQTIKEW